jgi:hypothetical protein
MVMEPLSAELEVGARDASPDRRASRLERIARRAHELYEARGCNHGRDQDDWFEAEKEIDTEDAEHAYQLSA